MSLCPWLEELLVHPKTKDALRDVSRQWYDAYCQKSNLLRDSEALDVAFLRATMSSHSLLEYGTLTPSFDGPLQRRIIEQLECPPRIEKAELRELAHQHLITLPHLFDAAYERFIGACLDRVDSALLLCEEFDVLDPGDLMLEVFTIMSPWGRIDCRFIDTLPITEVFDLNGGLVTIQSSYDTFAFSILEQPLLQCRIEAESWSETAFYQFHRQVRKVLRSVLQTLVLSLHFAPPPDLNPEEGPGELPPSRADQTGWDLVRHLVELHFQKVPKNHTLEQRLQMAQQLILEADRNHHASVSAVLCFAAMESLLLPGSNPGQISESLARAATNLLQPDPMARRSNREAIKKLYHLRSRLVHGSSAAEDFAARDRSRHLVAGTIKGVLEWARFRERLGDVPVRAEDLLEALKDADDGKRMIGVPDALAACLPK